MRLLFCALFTCASLWGTSEPPCKRQRTVPVTPPRIGTSSYFAKQQKTAQLCEAAGAGDDPTVESLLQEGVSVDACYGKQKRTALHCAAKAGHESIARLLLDAGAEVNKCDFFGGTALYAAVEGGHAEIISFLISRGANVNSIRRLGDGLLRRAALNGHQNAVRELLRAGAQDNCMEGSAKTALDLAILYKHWPVAYELVARGVDNIKDSNLRNIPTAILQKMRRIKGRRSKAVWHVSRNEQLPDDVIRLLCNIGGIAYYRSEAHD